MFNHGATSWYRREQRREENPICRYKSINYLNGLKSEKIVGREKIQMIQEGNQTHKYVTSETIIMTLE